MKNILITGGAGFIGSHLADELLSCGYHVRVLDNLAPQVHGPEGEWPAYLSDEVENLKGDVRDAGAVREALQDVDAVFHLAASVGVGQSMYKVTDYTDVNNVGTAVLVEELIEQPVERLIVASSMSIYGEGLYRDADGEKQEGHQRSREQLELDEWEIRGSAGEVLQPIPTPESKSPSLSSVYALSKYDQERLCLMMGGAYDIPAVALRFFNVFGPRQALSNPYTGVLAIFASRYLNGNPPLIFEDGYQQRDFVSVYDVAQACRLALETEEAVGNVFNIGSGRSFTVREVAEQLGGALGCQHIDPRITKEYRMGDIRHCFADISRAREVLGYSPSSAPFEDQLADLVQWLDGRTARDRVDGASAELVERGLTV